MRVQVAKWGNSLAVRLPGACLRQAGIKHGDVLDVEVTPLGEIRLTPHPSFRENRLSRPVASTSGELADH